MHIDYETLTMELEHELHEFAIDEMLDEEN